MIGVLLAAEGFGFDELVKFGAIFVFLVLPVIKKILLARSGGGEPEAGKEQAREREREAAEQWKRLMRGEQPEVQHEPEPVSEPLSELRDLDRDLVDEPLPEPPSEPLSAPLKPLASDAWLESRPLVDVSSPGTHVRHLDDTLPFLEPTESLGSLGKPFTSSLRAPDVVTPARPARKRIDWRRAVVLSEVLSQPLALRKHAPWMGRP